MFHQKQARPPSPPPKLSLFILVFICSSFCQHTPQQQPNLCDKIHQALQNKDSLQLEATMAQAEQTTSEPCFLELVPKYYWAQNMSHIIVKFEFLNSAQTSACDRVLSVKKHLDHNSFSVMLICLQSSTVIRYNIRVKTFMPMNHYHSVWRTAQQNTIVLTCLKSPTPYFWKSLYVGQHVPLRRPRIWWKIMEKYRENIGNYFYQLELNEEEADISGYVRRNSPQKKTKLTSLYTPSSNTYLYCNQNNPFELGSWIF